jgi:DNA-binding LacI/PurR family transcriptional regulator
MSDQLALGAVDAARALSLGVPGDLSVVGFDDVTAAVRAEPGLTTVRQPHAEKGRRAAQLLVASMQGDGPGEPAAITLPTELIVRGSTAPPYRR